jgi:hypothetical protein
VRPVILRMIADKQIDIRGGVAATLGRLGKMMELGLFRKLQSFSAIQKRPCAGQQPMRCVTSKPPVTPHSLKASRSTL